MSDVRCVSVLNSGLRKWRHLEVVRQAHLPGNYELYDDESAVAGPPICKYCWEKARIKNSSSLDTVWITFEDVRLVWWLCHGHREEASGEGSMKILKIESGLVKSPRIYR